MKTMYTLNPLPSFPHINPNSTITFFKSDPRFSTYSYLSLPNLRSRIQCRRTPDSPSALFNKPTFQIQETGTKILNFSYPSNPTSQILETWNKTSSFSKINGFPFCIFSKPTSNLLRAASEANPGGNTEDSKPQSLQLALIFGLWYFQNIVFNIYNKKVLNLFPFPWLLASFQLFVGSVWMLFLWSLKLQPCPKISKPFIIALLGPALFHTIGHISACVSFSKVAVSFTHVIKSSEPVFSVVFSSFLGDTYPLNVWLSIIPIVLGCSLAAVTEVSFNFQGLWGAMISNVGFVLRNIYSKKSLQNFKEVNGLNLYGWISIISLFYLFPVAVFVEGSQWVEGYRRALVGIGKPSTLYLWVIISGVFYHLYNQSSYQALDQISPLTFSVGNTMKRVVVIVSSILVFRNPVRPLNALGSAIAIFGTFLYSQATTANKAKKVEGEKKR
ncbi:xylulose 5-phosphate/phosphate translocator, chloroplastic [Macadamia integrifolia]|uniref:xylulose 5-phosphate/phosphate translocator, chloroplastic n=1 Tax=Macadamia integrifolia TaxID=60698 RepID=UPI001C4FC92F|nr:xylulose 5-phosphate/phosphate translocator, chloroplastic [Macadamia integrifolia]